MMALGKLADGRPAVTIVANGGGITLTEVDANIRAGRRMIVIEGSGRAADALVSLLKKTIPSIRRWLIFGNGQRARRPHEAAGVVPDRSASGGRHRSSRCGCRDHPDGKIESLLTRLVGPR